MDLESNRGRFGGKKTRMSGRQDSRCSAFAALRRGEKEKERKKERKKKEKEVEERSGVVGEGKQNEKERKKERKKE